MMKTFLDFLQAFFIPKKTRLFRGMSFLYSFLMLSFVLAILTLAMSFTINEKYVLKRDYGKISLILKAKDEPNINPSFNLENILNLDITINKDMKKNETTLKGKKKVVHEVYSYFNKDENKKVNVHFIFDPENLIEKGIDKVYQHLIEKFSEYKGDKLSRDARKKLNYLTYVGFFIKQEENLDFDELHTRLVDLNKLSIDEIGKLHLKYSALGLIGAKGYTDEIDFILFYRKYTYDVITPKERPNDKHEEKNNTYFETLTSFRYFVPKKAHKTFPHLSEWRDVKFLLDDCLLSAQSAIASKRLPVYIRTLFIVLLLPILVVITSWLTFRKSSRILSTFKDYFNISALLAIIPGMITFVCAFFIPDYIVYIFVPFYIIYYFSFILVINYKYSDGIE